MKTVIKVLAVLFLTSCLNKNKPVDSISTTPCAVSKTGNIVEIDCAGDKVTVADGAKGEAGPQGPQGPQGIKGENGKTLVGKARPATLSECPNSPGTAMDSYIDIDNSLSYTTGDVHQATVFTCNGLDGDSTAGTINSYGLSTANTCIQIATLEADGEVVFAKRTSNSTAYLFSSTCANGNSTSGNIGSVNSYGDEVLAHGTKLVFFAEGTKTSFRLFKLKFQ